MRGLKFEFRPERKRNIWS